MQWQWYCSSIVLMLGLISVSVRYGNMDDLNKKVYMVLIAIAGTALAMGIVLLAYVVFVFMQ